MTKREDTSHLMVGNTPPKVMVRAILKQIRAILNKEFHKVEESISVILSPTLRDPTSDKVVHNINILRIRANSMQLLIGETLDSLSLS